MTDSAAPGGASGSDAVRVLIVDDSALYRSVVVDLCGSAGLVPTTAADAESALDLIGAGHVFELVIMDVQLPGMSGPDAARLLHESGAAPLVLMTSALDWMDVAEMMVGTGAVGFVPKEQLDERVLSDVLGGAGTPVDPGQTPRRIGS